jgi:hypothetical protein
MSRRTILYAISALLLLLALLCYVVYSKPTGMTHYSSRALGISFDYPTAWLLESPRESGFSICKPATDVLLTSAQEQVSITRFQCPGDVASHIITPFARSAAISVAGRQAHLQVTELGASVVLVAPDATTYWFLFTPNSTSAWRLKAMQLTGSLVEPYRSMVDSIRFVRQ